MRIVTTCFHLDTLCRTPSDQHKYINRANGSWCRNKPANIKQFILMDFSNESLFRYEVNERTFSDLLN